MTERFTGTIGLEEQHAEESAQPVKSIEAVTVLPEFNHLWQEVLPTISPQTLVHDSFARAQLALLFSRFDREARRNKYLPVLRMHALGTNEARDPNYIGYTDTNIRARFRLNDPEDHIYYLTDHTLVRPQEPAPPGARHIVFHSQLHGGSPFELARVPFKGGEEETFNVDKRKWLPSGQRIFVRSNARNTGENYGLGEK